MGEAAPTAPGNDGPDWPAADFSRVPYKVFTEPQIYQAEQERVFRGPTWNYLALEAEIPNPGDYKTTYIGDTPVVVNRAQDGSVHAFVNRCVHRGTTLVRHLQGNADSHTCIYHHWCYDLEGNLIGVPFQRGMDGKGGMPETFRKQDHGLARLNLATYRGIVFGTMSADTEPLEDYLDAPMRAYFDQLFHKPVEVLGYMRQRMPANWKLYFENLHDPYHAGLLHQFQTTFGLFTNTQVGGSVMDKLKRHRLGYSIYASEDTEATKAEYQGTTVYNESLRLLDPSVVAFHDENGDRKAVNMMTVFPSAFFQRLSNTLATRHIRPKSPDEFELYWTYFGYADDTPELREIRMRQVNLVGPAGLVSMEDGEAGILVQKSLRAGGHSHSIIEMGGVGAIENQETVLTEVPVRGFWRYYCTLMGYRPG